MTNKRVASCHAFCVNTFVLIKPPMGARDVICRLVVLVGRGLVGGAVVYIYMRPTSHS